MFALGDAERLNWHYVPRGREGVPFKSMPAPARAAAHELMKASLSVVGYGKASNIISLEEVLRRIVSRELLRRVVRADAPGKAVVAALPDPVQLLAVVAVIGVLAREEVAVRSESRIEAVPEPLGKEVAGRVEEFPVVPEDDVQAVRR